jgi:uncharacterized protein
VKIVMPGGSGHVGQALRRHLEPLGHEFVVLTRNATPGPGEVEWDGKSIGLWALAFNGADVVINLAGRSVNCRYTDANLKEMMVSRIESTRVVGEAIAAAKNPPKTWLQASTATIYSHRFDAPNNEETGVLGGDEPGAPHKWNVSIRIAKAWEKELEKAPTPNTRKVAMRSAMTMSIEKGSVFDVFATLAKRGLGGQSGNGKQYVSWVHELDFVRAIQFLMEREDLDGPVNICSPHPLPNRDFTRILREAVGAKFSVPIPWPILEIGAAMMGTETELIMKSRRVIPTRLLEAGFKFEFPLWEMAAQDLAKRWRASRPSS